MSSNVNLNNLFAPGQIGRLSLRNRIVMAPMGTRLATPDGYVSQRNKDYYAARAKGGVGLIITELCIVESRGKSSLRQLCIYDDRFIPGLKELAQAIHEGGAKVAIQLNHTGARASVKVIHQSPVAPSPIPLAPTIVTSEFRYSSVPHVLTIEEIGQLVSCYTQAAVRAQKAGFDAVEVHGAHRYLVDQFLSSTWNLREDIYGGTLENRARFFVRIVEAIKEAVGHDYPVLCRMDGDQPGLTAGLTVSDACEVARMLETAGADAIDVTTVGAGVFSHLDHALMGHARGQLLYADRKVKEAVNIPIIAVGRWSVELAERALREGDIDFAAFGRALIADPELPNKARYGRLDDIRPCLGCTTCLARSQALGEDLGCVVNAAVGKEADYTIKPAPKSKKVLVIGGGPAGMEASRVAALRGHRVELHERENKLGGQLLLAAMPPHKEEVGLLTRYLVNQLGKLGVKIEVSKEVTVAAVEDMNPDVVVFATGVIPLIPNIPGIKRYNVVTAESALQDTSKVGQKVIVIGGGLIGCETAEFLAEKGKEVSIVEILEKLAGGVVSPMREPLLARLLARGVRFFLGFECQEVTESGLVVTDNRSKRNRTVEGDTIVLAVGSKPNINLWEELKGRTPETYVIGDCAEVRDIQSAIGDGARVALHI